MIEIQSRGDFLRNFQQGIQRVHLALGFQQVCIVQGDRGLLADTGKHEQVVFRETSAIGAVNQFHDAQHLIVFAQRRSYPCLDLEIVAGFYAFFQARFLRGFLDQFSAGLLGDSAEQSLRERNPCAFFDRRIAANLLRKVKFFGSAIGEPQIADAPAQQVANFYRNDGEKFAEFESRGKCATEVVECGQPFECGELGLALALDGLEVG